MWGGDGGVRGIARLSQGKGAIIYNDVRPYRDDSLNIMVTHRHSLLGWTSFTWESWAALRSYIISLRVGLSQV